MPQLSTTPEIASDPAAFAALKEAAGAYSPDIVYLVHEYNRDDFYGAGQPYRTLAAAIASFTDSEWDGPWIDCADIPTRYASIRPTPRDTEWWPLTTDGDNIPLSQFGDYHPYIIKAEVK